MSIWFLIWLITVALGWFVLIECWRYWRGLFDAMEANEQGTLDAWRRTIDDLEAANRRIAALETQLATERSGDEWKQ